MAKILTQNLSGKALVWATSTVPGAGEFFNSSEVWREQSSTDWRIAGALIERFNINLIRCDHHYDAPAPWAAEISINDPCSSTEHQTHDPMYQFYCENLMYGESPIEAIMRCLVKEKLGNEIEVPDAFKAII